MKIGIPSEIKNNENRVGMTPAGVSELVKRGHTVYLQSNAGVNSGFSDEDYISVGAKILPTIVDVYRSADMIVKVKEPIEPEYDLIRKDQLLFTYFHFASDRPLYDAMKKVGAVCIAYETVQKADHSLPLLIPMSEIAGIMAVQEGARFLEKPQGGKGILLSGLPGVQPAKVLILGAGHVGLASAWVAAGMGADVIVADINIARLREISQFLPKNVRTLYSTEHSICKELPTTDLVIGSVLIPGAKTPHLITRKMLGLMTKGSVMVDVAIDQGGCFETSHPTTHSDPVYVVDGIVHYAVANIPGAVAYSSTLALTNATLPYVIELAEMGWKDASKKDEALLKELNVVQGKTTFKAIADLFGDTYVTSEEVLR